MLVSVAAHTRYRGVAAPAFKGLTYDWRTANTAKVHAGYNPGPVATVFAETYETDAHCVPYVVLGPDGLPVSPSPRVNKGGLEWMHGEGYRLRFDGLMADIDRDPHVAWTDAEEWREIDFAAGAGATCGVYITKKGFRLWQPLTAPIYAPEVEGYLYAWLCELGETFDVDMKCRDWTRHYRLPHVRRDGVPYRSPMIDASRVRARTIVPRERPKPPVRRSRLNVADRVVTTDDVAPPNWDERVAILASAMRGRYQGDRHETSLGIAGQLLEGGVEPTIVPAIVAAAAAQAGWDPANHRQTAEWSTHQFAAGHSVRRTVPAALQAAIDSVTGATDAPENVDLEAEQRRLYRALEQAPEGLSLIRAGCGLGKTRSAETVAVARAAKGLKTVLSVPTNDLAKQVHGHLAGSRRHFGPAGDNRCKHSEVAQALAAGGIPIRSALCPSCDQNPGCPVMKGFEGDPDAKVIVGNHGLVGHLNDAAGKRGLLVIDEPPSVVEDVVFSSGDLAHAAAQLEAAFAPRYAEHLLPAIALAREVIAGDPGDPFRLCDRTPSPAVLDMLPEGHWSVAEAADECYRPNQFSPPLVSRAKATSLASNTYAELCGNAARIATWLRRALNDPSVLCQVVVRHGSDEKVLAITGINQHLASALRREGQVVVMAADVHVYRHLYEQLVPAYKPTLTEVAAPDGCAVRRVWLQAKSASRGNWVVRGRKPEALLPRALDVARQQGPKVAVVTFKALTKWVRKAAPNVDVGHYGALRGLDHWKGHDALITLGDPVNNLGAMARVDVDATSAARAELEQAHGRLRVVHRKTPCTMVHVGRLMPFGWPEGVEIHEVTAGRPAGEMVPPVTIKRIAERFGGVTALAREMGVSREAVKSWIGGTRRPNRESSAWLRKQAW